MKILHVIPSYKPAYIYGGTIESTARLCEGLAAAGHDVNVFTTTANGKEELNVKTNRLYRIDGVNVFYFRRLTKDPSHISLQLWKHLYRQCKQYDAVHLHSWWNILIIVCAQICKRQKVKTFFSPHGMLSDYIFEHSNSTFKKIIHRYTKPLLRYMIVHATSYVEMEDCKKILPNWKGFIAFNIVWLPELTIQKHRHKHFHILFLSRIHPKKGIELLLKAISKISCPLVLQIAGDGDKDYVNSLKRKVKLLGIEKKVEWTGWINREQKFTTLMNADLFALTSYNENFANVVVESLHVGTPVLISNRVGLAKFIDKNKSGWITSLYVPDIVSKLEQAINNKEARERIYTNGPLLIKKYISPETLIPEYIHHYSSN